MSRTQRFDGRQECLSHHDLLIAATMHYAQASLRFAVTLHSHFLSCYDEAGLREGMNMPRIAVLMLAATCLTLPGADKPADKAKSARCHEVS